MRKKAFTLIELICVIAILSIMAAFLIPRYTSLQEQAIEKQEEAIITTLKEAVNQKHMFNITSGLGDVWPGDSGDLFPNNTPFDRVSNPPPNTAWFYTSGDNVRWRTYKYLNYFYIACPHFNSSQPDAPPIPTRGNEWIYHFGQGGNPYNLNPGQVIQHQKRSH